MAVTPQRLGNGCQPCRVIFKELFMYKIMLDPKRPGIKEGTAYISEVGARIIWDAYKSNFPGVSQTMERRNERGGIAWLSEINSWIKSGHLPPDFDLNDYLISD